VRGDQGCRAALEQPGVSGERHDRAEDDQVAEAEQGARGDGPEVEPNGEVLGPPRTCAFARGVNQDR
jgi:hypothetical protein